MSGMEKGNMCKTFDHRHSGRCGINLREKQEIIKSPSPLAQAKEEILELFTERRLPQEKKTYFSLFWGETTNPTTTEFSEKQVK